MLNRKMLCYKIMQASLCPVHLALMLGISPSSMQNILHGTGDFSIGQALHLCNILKIDNNAEKAALFFNRSSQYRDDMAIRYLHI